MKRALLTLGCLFLVSQAAAQAPSPAEMGITPTTTPEVLQTLDNTKTWVPIGTVDPSTHTFTPVGGGGGGGGGGLDPIPADTVLGNATGGAAIPQALPLPSCASLASALTYTIGSGFGCNIIAGGGGGGATNASNGFINVTDPTVGMKAMTFGDATFDNSPYVTTLMNVIQTLAGFGNADVIFPQIIGATRTVYYFSQPFHATRASRFRCTGNGVALVFAAGVDGFVVDQAGQGATLQDCTVANLGTGGGLSNPLTNDLTLWTASGTWVVPQSPWQVGDGIITGAINAYLPLQATLAYPMGTTVTAISGSTLTLSNPPSPYWATAGVSHAGYPAPAKGTAIFTQTGTNNFNNNDTINVNGWVYTFSNAAPLGGTHNVAIGPDFATSAANLISAIANTAGQFVTYSPSLSNTATDYNTFNPDVTAAYASGVITFTSRFGGPAVNTFVSTYTTTGTAAGSFAGAHFTGAEDASNCPLPCNQLGGQIYTFKLPKAQAFKIQSYVGNYYISWPTATAPQPTFGFGDKVISDAFPFGSTAGQPIAASIFVETGANNFLDGDTMLVGNNTFRFKTLPSAAGDVAIGPDFQTSAKNFGAATGGLSLGFSGYIAGTTLTVTTPPATTPLSVGGILTTAGGVAAGTQITGGSGTTFTVSISQTVGSSGTPVALQVKNYVAPATGANVSLTSSIAPTWFMVHATTFSSPASYPSVYTPAGAAAGNFLAANFGSYTAVSMGQPGVGNQLATVTHAPGAEGNLWIATAGYKRRNASTAINNRFSNWPIGMQMACSNGYGTNCDLSRDIGNFHQGNLVGRWAEGDNYATSSSTDEQYSGNYIADDFELGTLGENLINPNFESTESGAAHWGLIMYCLSQNATSIIGGYIGGAHMCSDPVTVFPPRGFSGPQTYGLNAGSSNGYNFTALGQFGPGGYTFTSGNDRSVNHGTAVTIGGGPSATPNILSWALGGLNGFQLTWNNVTKNYQLGIAPVNPVMNLLYGIIGYTGYDGVGWGVGFPQGAVVGGEGMTDNTSRLFSMTSSKPTGNWHAQGDISTNTLAALGGQGAWYDASIFSTTLTGPVTKGTSTTAPVAACPTATIPAGLFVSDGGSGALGSPNTLGTYSSCSAGTMTFTATALNNGVSGDTVRILEWLPAMAISNDPVNPDYTATTIRSGSSANKDLTGRIALVGGTATYTLAGVYASAPNCLTADVTTPANANSVAESTTVLTFTGTGTDTLKWICAGRN